MAQRLKTDWLLFSTIVTMVGFGLVMIYSASSVTAQLNPRISSRFYFASRQLFWPVLSFCLRLSLNRIAYRALHTPPWPFCSLSPVLFLHLPEFYTTAH